MNAAAGEQIEKQVSPNTGLFKVWAYLKNTINALFFSQESLRYLSSKNKIVFPIIGIFIITVLVNILPMLKLGYEQYLRQDFEQRAAAGYMTQAEVKKSVQTLKSTFTPWSLILTVVAGEFLCISLFIFLISICLKAAAPVPAPVTYKQVLALVLNSWFSVSIIYLGIYAVILMLQEPENVKISQRMLSNAGGILADLFDLKLSLAAGRLLNWIDIFLAWKMTIVLIGYRLLIPKLQILNSIIIITIPIVISVIADMTVSTSI